MRYDGRNPYGSEGGYVVSSRGRRGRGRGRGRDRGMYPMENDMARRDMRYGDMPRGDSRADYRSYDTRGRDMHHPSEHGSTYYPIQAMGTFEGYYGMPNQQDYARSGGEYYQHHMGSQHYPQHMGERRDYGYNRYDYGYDYGQGDERLSEEELEHWCKKLKGQLDDREKQMFSKEMITQKAKQMGKSMDGFSEKELECCVIMLYLDYKKDIGSNPDLLIKMAFSFMNDEDSEVKGSEKLALYHDLVMGEL